MSKKKLITAMTRKITATERATQAALELPKGAPAEWDGKPVSTFPGRKIKPTPGQTTIDGGVIE